jgi:hypothetical protein
MSTQWAPEFRAIPVSISYSTAPSAHTSASKPYPTFLIISGARYAGVPQKVRVLSDRDFMI